jgi:hypothetical protein
MAESNSRHVGATVKALRILVCVEALAFILWGLQHVGARFPLIVATLAEPRIVPAFIVEMLCGALLAFSAYGIFRREDWAWQAAFGAHIVSAAGVVLGMTALALGGGPRTLTNDLYHIVMMAMLFAGVIMLQTPGVRSALEHRAGALTFRRAFGRLAHAKVRSRRTTH